MFAVSCSAPETADRTQPEGADAGRTSKDAGEDGDPSDEREGGSLAGNKARVLSVAPTYAVAEEKYSYRPKASAAEPASWKVDQGPPGVVVEADGTTVSWTPRADQKGSHSVTLSTKVGGRELSQSGEITVAVPEERAAVDVSSTSGGSAIVTAPKSRIAGASVQARPAGLKQPTRLTVSEVDKSPPMGIAKHEPRSVQFGPSGTVFSEPASISLPLGDNAVGDKSRVGAFAYDPKGRWVRVPVVSVDAEKGIVHAKAKHFSLYAAAETKLGLDVSAVRAPASGDCAGSLFVDAWLKEPLTEIEAAQVANLSETLLARADGGNLAELIAEDGVSGSFRFVRVIELAQGKVEDRVVLEQRLLVTTVYLAGDGSAVVGHADALGNLLGSFSFRAVSESLPALWSHLSGRPVRAVFAGAPAGAVSIGARLHAIYFDGDATLDPVSADDLGFALVDAEPVSIDQPNVDARDADLDCDGLVKAFDGVDNRLIASIVLEPAGVISGVVGAAVRLSASLAHASALDVLSYRVLAGNAALRDVAGASGERDFVAAEAGRFLVEVSAEVDGEALSGVFAIDVSPEATLPSCTPSPAVSTLKLGESVALSAVLEETSLPATSLGVDWGLLVDGAFMGSSELEARGYEARFVPSYASRYQVACRVSQGARSGAVGSTALDVVPTQQNLPPGDLTLSPSYETLLLGQTTRLRALARDPEGSRLRFAWSASGGTLGTPSSQASESGIDFSSTAPGLYEIRVAIRDEAEVGQELNAFVLVVSAAADTEGVDADGDGWPSGLDCNDAEPKVHPGAHDRCGDGVDDDCSGSAKQSDCDDDGVSVEAGDCDDTNREIAPSSAERCDGIDNDCDGERDEGFSIGKSCSVGRGVCMRSAQLVCSSDGFGAICPATPQPASVELCDGVDNDCDGQLDEDYVPHAVQCGVGACAASGTSACVGGKEQSSCVPKPPAASDPSCDGVDDDCNGQVDEDLVKLVEVCNGRDDDCDRQVDEGLGCAGTPAAGCVAKGAELCNGEDDDCNGRYDEAGVCGSIAESGTLTGIFWECANAACTALSHGGFMFLAGGSAIKLDTFDNQDYDPVAGPYCVDGNFHYTVAGDQLSVSWLDGSTPQTASGTFVVSGARASVLWTTGPADMLGAMELVRVPEQARGPCPRGPICQARELCGNGFDDDCDGLADAKDPSCVATCTGVATTEICDGLDNDCNGQIDDLKQGCERADAVGACRVGRLVCPQSGSQPSCQAGVPDALGELCADGADNDCDGATDELACTALSPGETCFNALDLTQGGVFTFAKGARDDVQGGCRSPGYVDRIFYLNTPAGLSAQYVIQLDGSAGLDVGASLYKAPAGYAAGQACPANLPNQGMCLGARYASHQYLDPASTYLLVVEAAPDSMTLGGSFTLSAARSNDGICAPGDGDGDGVTICAGDCNDAVGAIHPGAAELCNQVDDDCDAQVDEQDGNCATGLPGACGVGVAECSAAPTCRPVQQSARDYCGDGVDNDCNGQIDDSCVSAAGESCSNAIDVGSGGAFQGTLVGASDDAISRCGAGAGAEHFYRFTMPVGGGTVTLGQRTWPGGLRFALYRDCTLTLVQCAFKSTYLDAGTYLLAVEAIAPNAAQAYAFTLGIGNGASCATPDLDGDGQTACYGDCDESRADVNVNGSEGTACDSIDNDCNGAIDDVHARCPVAGLTGVCADGELRCNPQGGASCVQTRFADARGREICADGLDNDCDGGLDAQDPQQCVSLPAGDTCGLAQQVDLSAGGVFAGTLTGYADDVELGCGDYAQSAVERFYAITLSQPRVLRVEVRAAGMQGGYIGLALLESCASALGHGSSCGSSSLIRELPAGTYTLAVFGPGDRSYELLVSTQLAGDPTGTSCLPADTDADGYTLCNGDCREGNVAAHPGAAEVCDGLDNDCNMQIDDNIAMQPCSVAGGVGDCAQGMRSCSQGAFQCQGPQPGVNPELCNDGRDNDCDGMADDTGTPGVSCLALAGETCQDALPIAANGFFGGSLVGAANDGNGCYGGSAEERYYSFHVPAPGYYYLQLKPSGPGPFAGYSAGIFSGVCGPSMANDGCSVMGAGVVYYYLATPGPHVVVVESDEPFAYQIGLATMINGGTACSIPDGDGDGLTVCDFDCEDTAFGVHPGASEICNGIDDNCNASVDEGC